MKSSRRKTTALLLAVVCVLSGCGETVYVLEPDEEDAIAKYAAHTVAKYNTFQREGEVFVYQNILDGEEETEDASEEETDTQTDVQQESEQVQSTEEETADGQQELQSTQNQTENVKGNSSLTEALDLGVVNAECTGYELCTTYQSSTSYTVDALPDKQLLVLDIRLENQADQPLHIDILSMTPEISAVINDTEIFSAQTTILLNDLSTYQADIDANAVNDAVLVFEIPQDLTEISTLQLKITMSGKNFEINL